VDTATARGRIAARPDLCAFISLSDEDGPGPTVGVKDVIDVAGMVTTGGGTILASVKAERDAACVASLRGAGASVVGKTNLHEWALGPTSANPHFGDVRNPADPSRIPGGSSGGSAAAVAAGLCDWAIGTDTGGSVRMPAALCGVVGVKPTLGTVDTDGLLPLASTLDTIGPIAPDVRTAASALEAMTGRSGSTTDATPGPRRDLRVAVPRGWVRDLDGDTAGVWREVAGGSAEVDLPPLEQFVTVFSRICGYEAAAFHREWLETCPERYGDDVLERLRQGLAVTHDQYEAALAMRTELQGEISEVMATVDALVLPATACVAPMRDGPDRRDPLTRFLRPAAVTGHPAVVLPAPTQGLPVGIQFVGRFGEDASLLALARSIEQAWSGGDVRGGLG